MRRMHAADKLHLQILAHRFSTLSSSTVLMLLLNITNALVLACTASTAAGSARNSMPFSSAADGADSAVAGVAGAGGLHPAITGVLVSVGLSSVPLGWLALAGLAVQCNSKRMGVAAIATAAPAVLLPVSFYYSWACTMDWWTLQIVENTGGWGCDGGPCCWHVTRSCCKRLAVTH